MAVITKLAFLFSFMACLCLSACSETAPQKDMNGAFIAISVEDMDRALEWYQTVLGYEITAQGERPPPNGKAALLRKGHHVIELQARLDAAEKHGLSGGIKNAHESFGIFKLGFTVGNLDGTFADLKTKNVTFAHGVVDAHPNLGMRTFTIVDPEGNMIQFFGL